MKTLIFIIIAILSVIGCKQNDPKNTEGTLNNTTAAGSIPIKHLEFIFKKIDSKFRKIILFNYKMEKALIYNINTIENSNHIGAAEISKYYSSKVSKLLNDVREEAKKKSNSRDIQSQYVATKWSSKEFKDQLDPENLLVLNKLKIALAELLQIKSYSWVYSDYSWKSYDPMTEILVISDSKASEDIFKIIELKLPLQTFESIRNSFLNDWRRSELAHFEVELQEPIVTGMRNRGYDTHFGDRSIKENPIYKYKVDNFKKDLNNEFPGDDEFNKYIKIIKQQFENEMTISIINEKLNPFCLFSQNQHPS